MLFFLGGGGGGGLGWGGGVRVDVNGEWYFFGKIHKNNWGGGVGGRLGRGVGLVGGSGWM